MLQILDHFLLSIQIPSGRRTKSLGRRYPITTPPQCAEDVKLWGDVRCAFPTISGVVGGNVVEFDTQSEMDFSKG